MRNLKARYLWLICLVLIGIVCGLVVLCAYTSDGVNKAMIVLLVIVLVILTFMIQYATSKSFKFRPKKEVYIEKEYSFNDEKLFNMRSLGYKERIRSYGKSFLKIVDKCAYKVELIDNITKYYENTENDSDPSMEKKLNECKTFIGVEIFLETNEKLEGEITNYTIQGEKVLYNAYILKNNKLISKNVIIPNDIHKDNYQLFLDEFEIKEEEEKDQ